MKAGQIVIYLADAHNISASHLDQTLSWLSVDEKKQLNSFYDEKDKSLYATAHILKRYALSCETNISPEKLVFARTDKGAPYVTNSECKDYIFSMSHSDNKACCIVSNANLVGIDLEKQKAINPMEFFDFFSKIELSNIQSTKDFFHLWTLKEAYAKAIGLGLHMDFKSLEFFLKNGAIVTNGLNKEPDWYFFTYDVSQDYIMSFCIECEKGATPSISIKEYNTIDFKSSTIIKCIASTRKVSH